MKPERISEIDGKPLEPWRQHLLDAAAYMEEHGHCKGEFANDSGGVCVIGAINRVRPQITIGQLLEPIDHLGMHLRACPAIWNDRPETTKEMAVNALIGAALSK